MKKLYVLVDAGLSKSQQAVQSGHAVAEYLLENPNTEWDNGTLVYLKTPILETFLYKAEAIFQEPDLDNKITAIAFLAEEAPLGEFRLL
jgi:hypothetical protein